MSVALLGVIVTSPDERAGVNMKALRKARLNINKGNKCL